MLQRKADGGEKARHCRGDAVGNFDTPKAAVRLGHADNVREGIIPDCLTMRRDAGHIKMAYRELPFI